MYFRQDENEARQACVLMRDEPADRGNIARPPELLSRKGEE